MRRGITLYEVVLALALFAGSIAAISQSLSTGTRATLQSRFQSQAILLCETKMAEILAGAVPAQSAADLPFLEPGLDGWTWSATVSAGPRVGLVWVAVDVTRRDRSANETSFTISRLVRNPQTSTSASTATTAASSTSTSSGSSAGSSRPQ